MARSSRNNIKFDNSSIVIVCEGTETENKYLENLVNESHFIEHKIVPNENEIVDKKAKQNREKMIERKLQEGETDLFSGPEYYVGLPEVNQQIYDKFKAEPIKWVRAAQLYMERFNFAEGWAVYDLDNKSGRNEERHKKAYELAAGIDNLNIAFSAYSFEEWFLLHFERCSKAFSDSDNINTKVTTKGTTKGTCGVGCAKIGCTGNDCLGGYLRMGKGNNEYIKDYAKKNGEEYVNLTLKNLHRACVNAAWSRSLKPDLQPYQCNPYTDVDKLVLRLLGKENEYDICWIHVDEEFKFGPSKLRIHVDDNMNIILECISTTGFKVTPDTMYWCDDNYDNIGRATALQQSCLCTDKDPIAITKKTIGNAILCIKKDNQEFYIEID